MMPGDPSKIYMVAATGGIPEPLTSSDTNEVSPDWSPKGDAIIYGGFQGFLSVDFTRQPLRILDLKSHQSSELPGSEGLVCPRWSPDGRYIAASANGLDKTMLFDFASKQWHVVSSTPAVCSAWSSDSQYLYLRKIGAGGAGISRVRVSDSKVEPVADLGKFRGSTEWDGGLWLNLAPDDSPLLLRDRGSEEIYSLDWQLP